LKREIEERFPRAVGTLRELRSGVRRFLAADVIAKNRRELLDAEPWEIDGIGLDDNRITVSGWAFPPAKGLPRIELNGRPFDSFENHSRGDVGAKFWQRARASESGFAGWSALGEHLFERDYAAFSYANSPSQLPRGLRRDFYLLDPEKEKFPLPTAAQRLRVIGNEGDFGFRLLGATDSQRLFRAAEVLAGRPMRSLGSILDWGVGCGRIARYALGDFEGERFAGCDIDSENVAWCGANLHGEFHHIDLMPPLPFTDDAFDLIYGVSVFTHLRESIQDAWLAELQRVMKPGGIGLFTIHGRTALDYGGLPPRAYVDLRDRIESQGLVLGGKNTDLVGAVDRPDEYVNVYHSGKYVQKRWRQWFDIVAIVPGYIFTHDLVVVRKR